MNGLLKTPNYYLLWNLDDNILEKIRDNPILKIEDIRFAERIAIKIIEKEGDLHF